MTAAGRTPERWLVVANGHGEDHVAALVAQRLRRLRPELELTALPLVGLGGALQDAGLTLRDPRAALPSGGLTMHHPRLLWSDLRSGLVRLTVGQLATLRRSRVDRVLVVGDVYAHALAALVPARRSVIQTLVSVRMQHPGAVALGPRRFMEGFRWPELPLMRASSVDAVYVRDEPSCAWLRARGVPARSLGNAMMDGAVGGRAMRMPDDRPVVALLPGSRIGASSSATRMLAALELAGPLVALVAWTGVAVPERPPHWRPIERREAGLLAAWERGGCEVWWLRGRFRDVLASARAALGTSGTAQEQAAGVGLPVVSFVHPPLSAAFLANQKRLLGAALVLSAPAPEAIADALRGALHDDAVRAAAARDGRERMGPPGAADRIAADLLATP